MNPVVMQTRCAVVLVSIASFVCSMKCGFGDQTRPNILFLLADDLGYGDLHCYGREDVRTPHLDRLAAEGVRFTDAYANGPECTPTRVAFLTGRYQQRVGGLECAIGTGNVGRYEDAVRLRASHDLGLPSEEVTISRLLADHGYTTAIFGKWHLGYEPKFAPDFHGFHLARYCVGGGMDYFHYRDPAGWYNLYESGQPLIDHGYFTDRIADWAVLFLRENHTSPFFLYVPFTAPHAPYQTPKKDEGPLSPDSPLWNQSAAPPDVYRAMIERLDFAVGRILAALDEAGLRNDTLVIFASDNGGTRSARNAPLSGYKGTTFEGGIRVPAIVRFPGRIPPGSVSSEPCLTMDFTCSIAAVAGVAASPDRPFDGIDILKQVVTDRPARRTLYWRGRRGDSTWWGVRRENWKYVRHRKGDRIEEYLFDLSADIAETQDRLADHPHEAAVLEQALAQWEKDVRAAR
ncbi:sulfatase-like hydrolase/transferase [Thermostilla marina]